MQKKGQGLLLSKEFIEKNDGSVLISSKVGLESSIFPPSLWQNEPDNMNSLESSQFKSTEGGNRTHTTQGSPDFESGASTNFTTSAFFKPENLSTNHAQNEQI